MRSIKLNTKENRILNSKEMNVISGGEKCCGCACYYRNVGGSSIDDNMDPNRLGGGLQSPQLTHDLCMDNSRWARSLVTYCCS